MSLSLAWYKLINFYLYHSSLKKKLKTMSRFFEKFIATVLNEWNKYIEL